jgi:hypothetical protein
VEVVGLLGGAPIRLERGLLKHGGSLVAVATVKITQNVTIATAVKVPPPIRPLHELTEVSLNETVLQVSNGEVVEMVSTEAAAEKVKVASILAHQLQPAITLSNANRPLALGHRPAVNKFEHHLGVPSNRVVLDEGAAIAEVRRVARHHRLPRKVQVMNRTVFPDVIAETLDAVSVVRGPAHRHRVFRFLTQSRVLLCVALQVSRTR